PLFVDADDAQLWQQVDEHQLMRVAISAADVGESGRPVHLDGGRIRLAGPRGRPITQAVSRAIYERFPYVDGIAYRSRLDSRERCWAIHRHVPVHIDTEPLDPGTGHHRQVVQHAAQVLGLIVPCLVEGVPDTLKGLLMYGHI